MSSTSKKSFQASASKARKKARVAVRRVAPVDTARLPKPRTGFEALVEPIAALVAEYGDELGLGGIDVELMRSSLADYEALEADYAAAVNVLAKIENTRLVKSSTVWVQILLVYGRARQAARTNANLRGDLAPIESFMKTGPRKAKPTAPVATTT